MRTTLWFVVVFTSNTCSLHHVILECLSRSGVFCPDKFCPQFLKALKWNIPSTVYGWVDLWRCQLYADVFFDRRSVLSCLIQCQRLGWLFNHSFMKVFGIPRTSCSSMKLAANVFLAREFVFSLFSMPIWPGSQTIVGLIQVEQALERILD